MLGNEEPGIEEEAEDLIVPPLAAVAEAEGEIHARETAAGETLEQSKEGKKDVTGAERQRRCRAKKTIIKKLMKDWRGNNAHGRAFLYLRAGDMISQQSSLWIMGQRAGNREPPPAIRSRLMDIVENCLQGDFGLLKGAEPSAAQPGGEPASHGGPVPLSGVPCDEGHHHKISGGRGQGCVPVLPRD